MNRPSSKFCDQCGQPLEPRSDPRVDCLKSERKHVTVLFSDIISYRETFNRVDPEEVREMTRHLFEEMVKIISRYEGYVDRILWDGVLAVFGMPRTHEDDAIRALRAALEIQRMVLRLEHRYADRLGGVLAMRSGVATGLVVTGSAEERTGRHGVTVNLAARLRDLAAPGEVLVDSRAFSAAAGFFNFQAQPPVTVKGRVRPVLVYRVQSVTPQPDKVRRVHGLKARLIGRDRELKQLEDAALRLRRKEGTVLTVSGDAGTGKSRLIAELNPPRGKPRGIFTERIKKRFPVRSLTPPQAARNALAIAVQRFERCPSRSVAGRSCLCLSPRCSLLSFYRHA